MTEPRDGWAQRQSEQCERNIAAWPRWMRKAAGINEVNPQYMREAAIALLREADEIEERRKRLHLCGASNFDASRDKCQACEEKKQKAACTSRLVCNSECSWTMRVETS